MTRSIGAAAALFLGTFLAAPGTRAAAAEPAHAELPDSAVATRLSALEAAAGALRKLELSGYVQARWETAEHKSDTVGVAGSPARLAPANTERFHIRRARLKASYDATSLSQAVVYFDGGSDRTVRLLEAHVTLLDPWTADHRHALTVGQFNVPFGHEIELSSSVRELPERSRAENVLFAGERDRGARLASRWAPWLHTTFAILNGGGIQDPEFPTTDPTRRKDWTARVRGIGKALQGGASWYQGRGLVPLTGADVEVDRTRLGFDAQGGWSMPALGAGSLRGEWYGGRNANPDSIRALATAPTEDDPVRLLRPGADPEHFATDFTGGYVMLVQGLGRRLQAAARWDWFDPDDDADHDEFERLSLGANWFHDSHTRVTVAYDVPRTERPAADGGHEDPHDNLWTVQFQLKF